MMRHGKKGIPGTGQKHGGLEHHKSDWFGYVFQSLLSLNDVMCPPPLPKLTSGYYDQIKLLVCKVELLSRSFF